MKKNSLILVCALTIMLCAGCGGDDSVGLTGITVSESSISLPYGETYQIVAKTVPDNADAQTFSYSSNNESVATVSSSGVVAITGVGTAVITVSNGSFTQTITVTGNLKSITVLPASIPSFTEIGQTFQLSATTDPAIDVTFTWTSENSEIISVSETGLLESKGDGTVKITVSVGEFSKDVYVTVGMSEVEKTKKGWWKFDDADDLTKATIGEALQFFSKKDGGPVTPAQGPTADNKAAFVPQSTWMLCTHGMAPNGTDTAKRVNEYTVMLDVMVEDASVYHALIQASTNNSGEASMYFKSRGRVGQGDVGDSPEQIIQNRTWYRAVFSVKLGEFYHYYLNGEPLAKADKPAPSRDNGRHGLDPSGVVFFGDGFPQPEQGGDASYDDNDIYVAEIAIWDYALNDEQVASLGMFAIE
jgi:hypothetical protein